MDIFASIIINMNKLISTATVTNQSGKWEIWCTLGVERKFLDRLQHVSNTRLVSSFTESVQRNQFDTTNKTKLFQFTVKEAIPDVYMSF